MMDDVLCTILTVLHDLIDFSGIGFCIGVIVKPKIRMKREEIMNMKRKVMEEMVMEEEGMVARKKGKSIMIITKTVETEGMMEETADVKRKKLRKMRRKDHRLQQLQRRPQRHHHIQKKRKMWTVSSTKRRRDMNKSAEDTRQQRMQVNKVNDWMV